MHICYVTIDLHSAQGGGGIASYLSSMVECLARRGHQLTIVALAQPTATLDQAGVRVVRVPAPNLHWYLYRLLPIGKSLNLPVREMEWSIALWRAVAHIHKEQPISVVETGETAIWAARFIKNLPPIVVRGHGNSLAIERSSGRSPGLAYRLTRRLELTGFRRAAAITAVSRFQAGELTAELPRTAQTISVIPNPLPAHFAPNDPAETDHPVGADNPIVIYTGRIEARKGTRTLLRAIGPVAQAYPQVRFVIAGGRHVSISDADLETELGRESVKTHLSLLGHIPWPALANWYRQAAIFVMPSYYETFGISVIEAMAFGLPVVATRAGGLPEVVEDGVTGLLVPVGDEEQLACAILKLLRDPGLRAQMGQAGRKRVLSDYTVDKIADQTLAVYQRAAHQW